MTGIYVQLFYQHVSLFKLGEKDGVTSSTQIISCSLTQVHSIWLACRMLAYYILKYLLETELADPHFCGDVNRH